MDATTTARLASIHDLQSQVSSSPWSHDLVELGMAVAISLPISGTGPLLWLMVVGPPGCGKTEASDALRRAQNGYRVDSVSENWIASGYRDPKSGERPTDLLKTLDGKCVVFKEMSTLFSLRHEKVQRFIGDLQALYDGSYVKLTGTVGQTGGEARFTIFGCITPAALDQHRTYMSAVGSRFLFYRVPKLTPEQRSEGFKLVRERERRAGAERALKCVVAEHIDALLGSPLMPVAWTAQQGAALEWLADLLAAGRGVIRHNEEGDTCVQTEEPFRAAQQLRTLVEALVRVHGRSHVTAHELEMARRVVLSSLPPGRAELLSHLVEAGAAGATAPQCALAIGKSEDQAARRLDELARLGLVVSVAGPSHGGRPPTQFRVEPRFVDLIGSMAVLDHGTDVGTSERSAA